MLAECMELGVRNVRALKEHACRHGPKDLNPQVMIFRGGKPIAVVVMAKNTREDMVHMANACTTGFDADVLVLSMDTYQTVTPPELTERALNGDRDAAELLITNPVTGRRWQAGEIQEVAVKHRGIERGWVTEAISLVAVNRAGDTLMQAVPYGYSGRRLVWGEPDGAPVQARGFVPDALLQGMLHPSVSVMHPDMRAALGREQMDQDFADWLMTQGHGAVILLPPV